MQNLFLPPILWIVSIVTMYMAHEYMPLMHVDPTIWRTTAGLLLICAALTVTIWHKRLFRKEKTNINTFGKPDVLVEEGLFKYIRNPMYLGFLVSLVGLALLGGALSPWIMVVIFFVLADRWYIPFEEKLMLETFGEQYIQYQQRTRRWI